jgi:hypothetical protein
LTLPKNTDIISLKKGERRPFLEIQRQINKTEKKRTKENLTDGKGEMQDDTDEYKAHSDKRC